MRKFVKSVILSLMVCFASICSVFLLQAPLLTLAYYGYASPDNLEYNKVTTTLNMDGTSETSLKGHVIGNTIDNLIAKNGSEALYPMIISIAQIVLTLLFITVLFIFMVRVVKVFLKTEKLIRPYYNVFYFMVSILPVFVILASIYFRVDLYKMVIVMEIVFFVLSIALTIFSTKVLPQTEDIAYRKSLYKGGIRYE